MDKCAVVGDAETQDAKQKKNICDICGKRYNHRSSLSRHLLSHKVLALPKCPHCGKTFTRKDSISKHINRGHCPAASVKHEEIISYNFEEPRNELTTPTFSDPEDDDVVIESPRKLPTHGSCLADHDMECIPFIFP